MQAIQWNDLYLLLSLHRGRSLAAAAVPLDCDPSTVSRRLRSFEQRLGAELFIRTPEGLVPTDLALRLLPHAEGAEAAVLAATCEADGTNRRAEGNVRVAMASGFAAYMLAPSIQGFYVQHPGIQLELLVGVGLSDLTRMEADIAVRFVRPTKGDLISKRLPGFGGYAAVAARSYEENRKGPVRWIGWVDELSHLPDAQMLESVIGRRPDLTSNDMVAMVECLRGGGGAMLLPRALLATTPELMEVQGSPDIPDMDIDVWLVCHRARHKVPRVQAVWRWLDDLISGRFEALNDELRP